MRRAIARLASPGFALALGVMPAAAAPSALVAVTPLVKGSLPRIVIAYGRVEPRAAARRTVMAPLAATVEDIYVQQGADVAKGAPLVRLNPSPATAAAYAEAQSAVAVARALVSRTEKLVGQRLATRQQLADAEKSESDARARLAALQAQGAAGPMLLSAPFRAIVTAIAASPGAIVAEGGALLDLARPDGLVLSVGVVAATAATIAPGDMAQLTPLGEHADATGRVILRGAVVDPATGLVPVEIALAPGRFLLGEMAEARITTGKIMGYVVPHAAILVDDRGASYVMQAVGTVAKKVAVRVLAAAGDKDVISGPLDAAAPLVIAGNHQLDDGMSVRLADPDGKAAR